MTFPADKFPHFAAPPLNEVVLGVQFRSPLNYQQINAFEVWNLFKDKFPLVQEMMPIPPQFETFGLPSAPQLQFNMVGGAIHDRFWFLSPKGDELIQFQQDRLLHNWRKVGDGTNEYPRFETIIEQMEGELATLEAFFRSRGNERLFITQVEISYINHIRIEGMTGAVEPQKWLSFVDKSARPVDEFSCSSRIVLNDSGGRPYAKLYRDSGIGLDGKGGRILGLTLLVRGTPQEDNIAGAIEFLIEGRKVIAEDFIASTTVEAHEDWKRVQ